MLSNDRLDTFPSRWHRLAGATMCGAARRNLLCSLIDLVNVQTSL